MKLFYIIFIVATFVLTGCSSSYRTGQTPDDLYYSPARQTAYTTQSNNNSNSEYYNANTNDQYLMMKVQDPDRWSTFDDYGYDAYSSPYSSYGLGYGMGMGYYSAFSPWLTYGYWNPYYSYMSSYYMWNSFYNPYYYGTVIISPAYPSYYTGYTGLHPFNVNAYRNGIYNTTNSGKFYTPSTATNSYNNRNNYRRTFSNQGTTYYNNRSSNNNNFNNNNNQQPTRTYSPAPASSNGGFRSSGGGGGGFSRPIR